MSTTTYNPINLNYRLQSFLEYFHIQHKQLMHFWCFWSSKYHILFPSFRLDDHGFFNKKIVWRFFANSALQHTRRAHTKVALLAPISGAGLELTTYPVPQGCANHYANEQPVLTKVVCMVLFLSSSQSVRCGKLPKPFFSCFSFSVTVFVRVFSFLFFLNTCTFL